MAVSTKSSFNPTAVLSILLANFVMTINQVNISPIFTFGSLSKAPSISEEFNLTVYGLGILTSAFYLGYGGLEVPGGILAARLGPKKIAILGTAANAIGVLGSALTPSFPLLVAFRFVAGFGFAFTFPSAVVLIVRYYRAGQEGFGISLMGVSFAIGSLTGYFGWAVMGETIGWRPALLVAGVLDLAAVVAMLASIPHDRIGQGFKLRLGHLRSVIASRQSAVLSVALFGLGSSYGLIVNFMIYYLEGNFGLAPGLAGSLTSLGTVFQLVSAPPSGRMYDRIKNVKLLVLVAAAALSAGVMVASVDSLYAAIVSVTVSGLAAGSVFTVTLAMARRLASADPEYESLTVGWMDSFALFGNTVSPLYFSALVLAIGYSSAWLIGGVVAILMTLPILLVTNESFRGAPRLAPDKT